MSTTVLGVIAAAWGVCMGVAPVFQIRAILARRSSEGLSLRYLLVLVVGFALWFSYGLAKHDAALIISNVASFTVMAVTIAIALRFR